MSIINGDKATTVGVDGDNIKMNLKEKVREGVDWIDVA